LAPDGGVHHEPTARRARAVLGGEVVLWSVTVDGTEHTGIVWGYDTPLPESTGIAGLVSFYPERVDLIVDGEPDR
jgi:uncharacterized protein (DUF427 family)